MANNGSEMTNNGQEISKNGNESNGMEDFLSDIELTKEHLPMMVGDVKKAIASGASDDEVLYFIFTMMALNPIGAACITAITMLDLAKAVSEDAEPIGVGMLGETSGPTFV